MNETQFKKIGIIGCFLLLVAFLVAQSIIDNVTLRRADTAIDNLEQQLATARAGIVDSKRTITECYNSVGRIAEELGKQSDELSDIISNLKVVREEVANMENALNYFYDKYSDNICYTYNYDEEVE